MTHLVYYPTYSSQDQSSLTSNDIFVFKTNVITDADVDRIASILSEEDRIKRWSVDRFDIDNVLRIESQELTISEILALTRQAGYHCEELPD